jgi:hypothetical protein
MRALQAESALDAHASAGEGLLLDGGGETGGEVFDEGADGFHGPQSAALQSNAMRVHDAP